jgi:hypothetical protein
MRSYYKYIRHKILYIKGIYFSKVRELQTHYDSSIAK